MYAAEPSKPAEVTCERTPEGSTALSWKPPINDGGKPSNGYFVQKREHGSDKWTKYVSLLNTSTFGSSSFSSARGLLVSSRYSSLLLLF